MDKNIFAGLEELGFKDTDNLNDIYKKNDKTENSSETPAKSNEISEASYLYNQTVTCPICGTIIQAKSIRNSVTKITKRDSDLFNYYSPITPYFYDVWLCNKCGYAAMKSDFLNIREFQKNLVKQNISPKWHSKIYPDVYDVNIALERYKLSLLNYTVTQAASSKKAMNCLKIAWMYRLLEDTEHEKLFLSTALEGFNDAYTNEKSPIYGMDKFTLIYLIAELYRRVGKTDEALLWFSNVITTPGVNQRLKEKARDQKDLVREEMQHAEEEAMLAEEENIVDESLDEPKKKGFFSKFFG